MVSRLFGALVRAFLVLCLVVMPAMLIPGGSADDAQIVALIGLAAAAFTLFEYASASPSLIEFRDAPPYNRIRFATLFMTVLVLSMIMRGHSMPNVLTELLTVLGAIIGQILDFPYSPVRLVVLMMPEGSSPELLRNIRTAAGLAYFTSIICLVIFCVSLRWYGWPAKDGAFNVFVNLPTFDPTVGGDVVERLNRDSRLNLMVGFLLPFIIPACVKIASEVVNPDALGHPQTMIWTMTIWAFLPASLLMRGVAMGRVAQMIEGQRRQRYADMGEDGAFA